MSDQQKTFEKSLTKMDEPIQRKIYEYKKSLSKNEMLALNIAEDHLESSFSLEKSIGFIKFMESEMSATK